MELILKILLIILLLSITYQDIKYRAVWWILFPLTLILQIFIALSIETPVVIINYFLINLIIVSIQLLVLFVYFYLKNRGRQEIRIILLSKLGLGDILFFVILAAAFSTYNFVIAFVLLLILSLIVAAFTFKKNRAIPLAGIMATGYALFLLLTCFVPVINPYVEVLNFMP